MSEFIDIQKHSQLDHRLNELVSAIEELRQAVEAQTIAQERFTRELSEMICSAAKI